MQGIYKGGREMDKRERFCNYSRKHYDTRGEFFKKIKLI
jgi:hypothetical protein